MKQVRGGGRVGQRGQEEAPQVTCNGVPEASPLGCCGMILVSNTVLSQENPNSHQSHLCLCGRTEDSAPRSRLSPRTIASNCPSEVELYKPTIQMPR